MILELCSLACDDRILALPRHKGIIYVKKTSVTSIVVSIDLSDLQQLSSRSFM